MHNIKNAFNYVTNKNKGIVNYNGRLHKRK